MKIVYCGVDFFSNCLELLLEKDVELVEIFSFKSDGRYHILKDINKIAEKVGCPMYFRKIKDSDIKRFAAMGVDYIICGAYPYKIPDLETHSIRGINIHPSLLPIGRGPWPLPCFILRQEKLGGVTLHKINSKWDGGDIILQESFNIDVAKENLESLSMKVRLCAYKLISEFFGSPKKVQEKLWKKAKSQTKGEYWKQAAIEEATINWNTSVSVIDRIIRAFGKCDSVAVIEGKQYIVSDATVWKQKHKYPCGTVVSKSIRETLIAAKDGFVCLRFFELDPDIIGNTSKP